jgi:hypothetical protein
MEVLPLLLLLLLSIEQDPEGSSIIFNRLEYQSELQ